MAFLRSGSMNTWRSSAPFATFHLGADEAYTLGECPRCRAYAAEHSLSELYIDHINAMSRPLVDKGIRPAIWGDMVLHHPEALDKLSRRGHDLRLALRQVRRLRHGPGLGPRRPEPRTSSTADARRFGAFLYPLGDEPGRDPDPFYTSDFLAANGFDVVVCPSSSCYGDSVFAPRTYFHMRNTADSFRKGSTPRAQGRSPDQLDRASFPMGAAAAARSSCPASWPNTPAGRSRTSRSAYVSGALRRRRPGVLRRRGPAGEARPVQFRLGPGLL